MTKKPGRRVLVVETDALTMSRWLGVLDAAGIEAVGERTLREARRHFARANWQKRPFDCVLLELLSSDGLALDVVDDLTGLQPAPRIGVASDSVDNALAIILMRRSISLLVKPIQPSQLLECVVEMHSQHLSPQLGSAGHRSVASYSDAFGLSRRERQVLERCIAGYSRGEVAAALGIGVGSVHRLWGRILARTGNASQDGVLRQVIRHVAELSPTSCRAMAS